jgi:choloylglycine hydrolase
MFSTSSQACTAFFFKNSKQMILAKNLDWPINEVIVVLNRRGLHKTAFTQHDKKLSWCSKYGSFTFNLFGVEFPLSGMNEKGLVIEELNSWGQTPSSEGMYTLNEFQWVQYCLDSYSSVKEVINGQDSIVIVPEFINLHYLLADKDGNVAVIEFHEGKKHVYSGADLPYSILSNNHYENSLSYLKNFESFGGKMNIPRQNTSNERFVRVASILKDTTIIGKTFDAFSVLDSVRQEDTQLSIVYDLQTMEILYFCRHCFMTIEINSYNYSHTEPCWIGWTGICESGAKYLMGRNFKEEYNNELLLRVYEQHKANELGDKPKRLFKKLAKHGNKIQRQ